MGNYTYNPAKGGSSSGGGSISAIHNREKVLPFFLASLAERCIVYKMGDSNETYAGAGQFAGLNQAIHQEFNGLWATGIRANGSYQITAGYFSGGLEHAGNIVSSGAPSGAENLWAPFYVGSVIPAEYYAWLPSGQTSSAGGATVYWDAGGWGEHEALKFHVSCLTQPGQTGSFGMAMRDLVHTNIASTLQTVPAGNFTDYNTFLTIPTNENRRGLYLEFSISAPWVGNDRTGPLFVKAVEVEYTGRTRGLKSELLLAAGGKGLYEYNDYLEAWQTKSGGTVLGRATTWLTQTTRLANAGSKRVKRLWVISSGLNDRNKSLLAPTKGPNPTSPGNTAAAFKDNLYAIYLRIKSWVEAWGGDFSDDYFLITTDYQHENIGAPDSDLRGYIAVAKDFSNENSRVAVADFAAILTPQQAIDFNYHDQAIPDSHYTYSGYVRLWRRMLRALIWGEMPALESDFVAEAARQRLFAMRNRVTVANTAAATTLLTMAGGSGVVHSQAGGYPNTNPAAIIPQRYLEVGRSFMFEARGRYSYSSGTIGYALSIGGTNLIAPTAAAPPAATNQPWRFNGRLMCMGITGDNHVQFEASGELEFFDSAASTWKSSGPVATAGAIVVTYSMATPWNFTVTWSVANAGNTITCNYFTVECLK